MKIAAVTNDGRTISAHFGRARAYVVATIEDVQVVAREYRERPEVEPDQISEATLTVEPGFGASEQPAAGTGHHQHARVVGPIQDCDVVLSRGMGAGMHQVLRQAHIRPLMTDIVNIDEAIKTFIEGRLVNRPELVH